MIVEGLRPLAVPIDSVRPLERNARQGNVEVIKKSLERFGQRRAIVVRQATGEVTAGNHMLLAAIELGWTEVAAIFVNDDEQTATAWSLADNRSHDLGGYDNDLLTSLIEQVLDFDESLIEDAGFDMEELLNATTGMIDLSPPPPEVPVEARPPEVAAPDATVIDEPPSFTGATPEPVAPEPVTANPVPTAGVASEPVMSGEEPARSEPEEEAATPEAPRRSVISYTVVFDTPEQQQRWVKFARWLKEEYVGETLAARLDSFLEGTLDADE